MRKSKQAKEGAITLVIPYSVIAKMSPGALKALAYLARAILLAGRQNQKAKQALETGGEE